MKNNILEAFKGLSAYYYLRQLFFGVLIASFAIYMNLSNEKNYFMIVLYILNTLIYPYSRWLYEYIVEYIMGNNVFVFNGILFLITKLITILLCWIFAVFVAPIGLVVIYFIRKKQKDN